MFSACFLPRRGTTSIISCSLMIADSGKAGFLMMLTSDPESSSRFVFVFKSGETILTVEVFGVSFIFIETIRKGRRPNLSPTPGDSCLLFCNPLSSLIVGSPDFLTVLEHDWMMVLPECSSVLRESFVAFG